MLLRVLSTSGLVLVVWVIVWLMHRRYKRRMIAQFEACECNVITKRAIKMHNAVEKKIAAQDSRNPDSPLASGKVEPSATEEHKAI